MPVLRSRPEKPMVVEKKFRTVFVTCMVLFGLQIWSPLMLQAAGLPGVSDDVTLRPLDPSDPGGGHGPDLDLCPSEPHDILPLPILLRGVAQGHQCNTDDRSSLSLLPTTGLQPAAP